MKILICGTVVPEQFEVKIEQLSNAGNRFLLNLIQELKTDHEVRVLSYLGIDVEKKDVEELKKISGHIRYVNKSRFKVKGMLQCAVLAMRWMRKAEGVMTYNAMYAWLFIPFISKAMKVKSVLILADFSPGSTYKNPMRKLYAELQLKAIRKYDTVIGLSLETKRYLKRKQKFICIEGGISRKVYEYFSDYRVEKHRTVGFMYAGILEPVTGIDLLLRAFGNLKGDCFELWISGKGTLASMVKKAGESDHRIKYLGCPPYEDYLENLSRADILINPRNMNMPENRNNFPSKVMEYMATGKNIISTRFPGWERFDEYMVFCDSDPEALLMCMKKAVESSGIKKSEWEKRREFAQGFLWENQARKICEACGASCQI